VKVLIIGGTRFLGRHLVEAAVAHGHEVTLFNRGLTNPELFPQLKTIRGDREKDLGRLAVQRWDAVIDTCGYVPRLVKLSVDALKDSVKSYVFISSISVYADASRIGIQESDAVSRWEDQSDESSPETYGPRKAACEAALQDGFGSHALLVRPGLIVGPHDPTDRFTYWPVHIARGGEVLVPDRPGALTQFIDVRDLSVFLIQLIEQKVHGVFNATGESVTLGTLFETCKRISRSDATFQWAPVDFLNHNRVEPWSDLPAWLPDTGQQAGFAHVDISKAQRAGLSFHPLAGTVKDTLEWANTRSTKHEWQAGLDPKREKELLALLKQIQ